MEITLNSIGSYAGKPATILELEISSWNCNCSEEVTDNKGFVDVEFIEALKSIVEELEDHNNRMIDYINKGI